MYLDVRVRIIALACALPVSAQSVWSPLAAPPIGGPDSVYYDEVRDLAVGFPATGAAVWQFDGLAWSSAPLPNSPPGGGGGVFDVGRQRVVWIDYISPNADTWEFDGLTWTMIASNTPFFESLVLHRGRGRVMGFGGGFTRGLPGNELHEWDGSNWVLAASGVGAPPRQAPSPWTFTDYLWMGYDERRDRLILAVKRFHDGTRASSWIADTWEWEAASGWSNPTQVGPAAFGVQVFDRHRGVQTFHQSSTVLWERLDSGPWSPVLVPGTPGPTGFRTGPVYDSRRGRTLVLEILSSSLGMWSLAPANPATYDLHGAGCSAPGVAPDLDLAAPWARAWLGGPLPFEVELAGLPLSIGVLAMGFSDQVAGGASLPIDLQAVGMPGCVLRIAPEATLLAVGANGRATVSMTLPTTSALLGQVFFQQGFVPAPGVNAAGALMTPSRRGVVGNW